MYDTKKVVEEITLDRIQNTLNEIEIYNYYTNKKMALNKPMNSPLRSDNNPSFSLFRAKNGTILYKDFSTGESGNVIKFVKVYLNLTYGEALNRIWTDLVTRNNGTFKRKKEPLKLPIKKVISIKRKYLTKTDDDYWGQIGIDRDTLKLFKVFPINSYWVNDIEQKFKYSDTQPMYAYKIFNKFKIYRPFSLDKRDKWRSTCSVYDIQGFEQLPEQGSLLIITKSLKDVMVLKTLGYNAIAPSSENTTIPAVIIDHLRTRFKKLVIFYDYDEGGIKGATTLSEKYNLPKVFIPKKYLLLYGIKDISDFRKEMRESKTIEILKILFNKYNDKSEKD
jgi:DNA primase